MWPLFGPSSLSNTYYIPWRLVCSPAGTALLGLSPNRLISNFCGILSHIVGNPLESRSFGRSLSVQYYVSRILIMAIVGLGFVCFRATEAVNGVVSSQTIPFLKIRRALCTVRVRQHRTVHAVNALFAWKCVSPRANF